MEVQDSITGNEIHLWLTDYSEIRDQRLLSTYRELLNSSEREQELRFHFAQDRHRYLVTRALVRTVLSRYVSVTPADLNFAANAFGRPELANVPAENAGVGFNLSHTHSLIVLGVARGRALGVDVENSRAQEAPIDMAEHYFSPAEVAALASVQGGQQKERFFEYWTLKESYIKARGMGLSLPLDKFSFLDLENDCLDITMHPEMRDDATRWQFWQFRPAPHYLVAICAERLGAESLSVAVRRIIPLQGEEETVPHFLRTSQRRTQS